MNILPSSFSQLSHSAFKPFLYGEQSKISKLGLNCLKTQESDASRRVTKLIDRGGLQSLDSMIDSSFFRLNLRMLGIEHLAFLFLQDQNQSKVYLMSCLENLRASFSHYFLSLDVK